MGNLVDEILKGRKTFFIAPDRSLFPQAYLEEYITLGFECYFIDTDIFLPIEIKIEIILSVFKDSILFFNIDAPLQDNSWPRLISHLKEKFPEARFGVTYSKRQSLAEKAAIEKLYLYTIGINCGCIQFEYQKKNNFKLIEKVLYANQAAGRRKNVRAVCANNCKVQFDSKENSSIHANLNDISISHFSLTLPEGTVEIAQYEKIKDITFTIKGLRFHSDAILFMKRTKEDETLYVFAFLTKSGQRRLDITEKNLLVPKIYEIMVDNCTELLDKLFNAATQQRKNFQKPNLEALSDLSALMEESENKH